ncbi:MAG TPA: hypothetical protein PK890_04455 [Terrimesophilobacter sp.]|nr:hypothetical protein [Terrimesophilobacter sp.]
MYDFSPSFVLVSAFSPEAGSLAAVAAGFDGTVCRWLHETSQVSIDVSVAQPDAASLEVLRSTASSGTLIMDVGDEAFFDVVDGVGATQVFSGSFWLTVASAYFTSPTDGAELVDVIVGSVR